MIQKKTVAPGFLFGRAQFADPEKKEMVGQGGQAGGVGSSQIGHGGGGEGGSHSSHSSQQLSHGAGSGQAGSCVGSVTEE